LPVSVVGRRRFHGNTHFAASDDAMADARDTLELFGVEVQEPRKAAAGSARPASADRARRHPSRNTRSLCVNPHFSIDPPPRLEDPECRTRDRYMED